jgi:hypothetical protein
MTTSIPEHNSFIHDLQIASPCKMDWDKMTGDERKRFCDACKLNVYNISSMTLPEAEALIIGAEGRVCVRLYRRKDGTVITQDCPVGLKERVKRRMLKTAAYTAAAFTVFTAWLANWRFNDQPSLVERWRAATAPPAHMMGAVMPSSMGEVAMPVPRQKK